MADTEVDDSGFPVLFAARAPGQVATQQNSGVVIHRGAASGNPNADTGSGRFTGKGGGTVKVQGQDVVVTQQTSNLPQGVTAEQWQKRQDIVRDAARQIKDIDPAGAKAFLAAHPNVDASKVDVDSFVADVKAAMLDDLTDALNQQLHGGLTEVRMGNRRIKSVFNGLDDAQAESVVKRLEGRGWKPEDIRSRIVERIANGTRKSHLEQLYGEPDKEKK